MQGAAGVAAVHVDHVLPYPDAPPVEVRARVVGDERVDGPVHQAHAPHEQGAARGGGRSPEARREVDKANRPADVRAAGAADDFVHVIAPARAGSAITQRTPVAAPSPVVLRFSALTAPGGAPALPGPVAGTL